MGFIGNCSKNISKPVQNGQAPKPQLLYDLYDWNYTVPLANEPMRFMGTEFKPVFDAADFVRFLGSFHCATLDIRRRGELKSYF